MKEQFIAIIDSGIGGISVLKKLVEQFPKENFIYLSDNDNVPYGNKTDNELLYLSMKMINNLSQYNLKAIVFGCNTLSVKVLHKIKHYIDIPIFGTFPPVERAILTKEKTILLCTRATANFYSSIKSDNFVNCGLSTLASKIENNKNNLYNINFSKILQEEFEDNFQLNNKFNNVILGCTHYYFIKNQIINHFQPQKIYDCKDFLIKKLSSQLNLTSKVKKTSKTQVIFLGKNKIENEIFYKKWLNE